MNPPSMSSLPRVSSLSIAIVVFVVLEALNGCILYFFPGTRRGKGVGVFHAYEESKSHPEINALVQYLVNWVAGTKLIFVALLIVILATGNDATRLGAVVALVLSILSFYWRLFPAIRRMDEAGQITPRGYSKTLGAMIGCFLGGFVVALIVYAMRGRSGS
ncbi:MAG: hypothetical protein WCJ30_21100, partial [Deltaproteobacteria bacterium]